MRFVVVLNSEGGTLRTTNLDTFSAKIKNVLEGAGHSVDIETVEGKQIEGALKDAAARRDIDVVMAGGGDGTVSVAAAILMDSSKALAILPAGTMNLFARSLGIPQSLEGALAAFASGDIRSVDMASANGQPFVHQFSIGLHADMVHRRDKMSFASRLGKIRASIRAAYRTILNPPSLNVSLSIGEAEILARASGIGVSNNLFGEGHLPYADEPDGGKLGVYITVARRRGEVMRLAFGLLRGRWQSNDHVEVHEAEKVILTLKSRSKRFRCVIDGELGRLERRTVIQILPKTLKVLVPRQDAGAKAA